MTPILWPIVSIVGSIAVLGSVIAWSRLQVRDLQAASSYLSESYKAAQRLVKAQSTPDRVLDFVEWYMGQAGKPQLARRLALTMIGQHLGGETKASPGTMKFQAMLRELPKSSADAFGDMVLHGVLASAAADPIFSRAYLKALNFMFDGNTERDGDKVRVTSHPSIDRAAELAADLTGHSRSFAHAG